MLCEAECNSWVWTIDHLAVVWMWFNTNKSIQVTYKLLPLSVISVRTVRTHNNRSMLHSHRHWSGQSESTEIPDSQSQDRYELRCQVKEEAVNPSGVRRVCTESFQQKSDIYNDMTVKTAHMVSILSPYSKYPYFRERNDPSSLGIRKASQLIYKQNTVSASTQQTTTNNKRIKSHIHIEICIIQLNIVHLELVVCPYFVFKRL